MLYRFGQLEVDADARSATLAGKPVELGPKEFDILAALAAAGGAALSRPQLIERIWHSRARTHVVHAHISQLRAKLKAAGALHEYVRSVPGQGYRIKPPPEHSHIDEVRLVQRPSG